MIIGAVSPFREAVVRIDVRGSSGNLEQIEAVIDTGFTDFLTLPLDLIRRLGLPLAGTMRVTLADRSQLDMDAYFAQVIWGGIDRTVTALAATGDPLVGMSLLYGHELKLWVVDGGSVIIERIA